MNDTPYPLPPYSELLNAAKVAVARLSAACGEHLPEAEQRTLIRAMEGGARIEIIFALGMEGQWSASLGVIEREGMRRALADLGSGGLDRKH